jgi:hypothetical protein
VSVVKVVAMMDPTALVIHHAVELVMVMVMVLMGVGFVKMVQNVKIIIHILVIGQDGEMKEHEMLENYGIEQIIQSHN